MAERVTYVALSFFVFFFVGYGPENKDAAEGQGQVPNRCDTLWSKDALDS
jgi:hypothetical protein